MLVLLTEENYVVCLCDGLSFHEVHTKFHEGILRLS
jgi:hypothetical protein